MSWLLFMDESGHDHSSMPYEVRGGFAIHAGKLWPFIQSVRNLEQATFGVYLSELGVEIKGQKLLTKDRFKWSAQGPGVEPVLRRKNALNFLNSSLQKRSPRQFEYTSYGQACITFAEGIVSILAGHDAKVFASIIPAVRAPANAPAEYLRKDHVFLFERYFAFLEGQRASGLIIMDGTQKDEDRRFVQRMERYFTLTHTGRQRTAWIVPIPLFVESDMAYGVQAANVLIYTLNWGFRLNTMDKPTRPELEALASNIKSLQWQGDIRKNGEIHHSYGIVYIPDPYEDRRGMGQK